MAKKLKRFLRADFVRGGRPLPRTLEFLRNIKFHALVEDSSGERIKRTVELLPRDVKVLAEGWHGYENAVKKNNELAAENRSLDRELSEARRLIGKLEFNNSVLMVRLAEKPDMRSKEKSQRNYFNVAEDAGFQPNGLALQGGLPSLGKKK